jgi:hypothetical protein
MSSEFSAEVYHTLVNAGFFTAALVQLSVCLRRILTGYRSSYPASWTTRKLLVLSGAQIAIGLLTAVAWAFTFFSIQRAASPFGHGIIVEEVGLPLFAALASTLGWLWAVTPRAWSNRATYEIVAGFVALLLLVVFMQYAPTGRP